MFLNLLSEVSLSGAIVRPNILVCEYVEEEALISGAVSKRRSEFIGGRQAAREALGALGVTPAPLLQDNDKLPCWPSKYTGSISHCDSICGAIVTKHCNARSIGLDVEPNSALPYGTEKLILSSQELEANQSFLIHDVYWQKLVFVAKEAMYKCIFPISRTFLNFHDLHIHLNFKTEYSGSFDGRFNWTDPVLSSLIKQVTGRWLIRDNLIWAVATLV